MSEGATGWAVFAAALIECGVPVVLCHPNLKYPNDGRADVLPPRQWHLAEPDKSVLDEYVPGHHILAMVTGHGIDVVDIDAKTGADLSWLPFEPTYGLDSTPGGGWHIPVPSTGHARGVLRIDGKVAGDYLGGTSNGGARGLCYLPGANRPKYPMVDYDTVIPWDLAGITNSKPDPILLEMLDKSGLPLTAKAGASGGQPGDIAAFLESAPPKSGCNYGRSALDGLLAESPAVGGRHAWGMRAVARIVELVAAGCAGPDDIAKIRDKFRTVKPEAPTSEFTELLLWAVNNSNTTLRCDHYKPTGRITGSVGSTQVGADWEPVDLSVVTTTEPVRPTRMLKTDGHGLLYPGLVHSIAGESESFKSGIALWEAAVLAREGKKSLYLDFESDARSIGLRLVGFGLDTDQIKLIQYVRPSSGFSPERIDRYLDGEYELVVIDGVTEFLSLSGGDTNSGDAVARLYQQLPHALADKTGAAVVLIDHVSKPQPKQHQQQVDNRSRFPIGSQHKLAALSGAGYVITPRSALQPGATGWLDMEVVKDRPGLVRERSSPAVQGSRLQLAASIEVDSTEKNTVLTLHPPRGGRVSNETPQTTLAAVSGWVGRQGRLVPKPEVELVFKSAVGDIGRVLDILCTHGYLEEVSHGGGRSSYKHKKSFLIGVDQI